MGTRAKRKRRGSQTFCERADVYCPRERRSSSGFGLESLAILALLYVGATALSSGSSVTDVSGSPPQLKPPRKTQPGAAEPETEAGDGSAKQ